MEPQELIDVTPESTAITKMPVPMAIERAGVEQDPEAFVLILERKAALAVRVREAKEQLLIASTYVGDWTIQDEKACLGSAGAERVGSNFAIQEHEVTNTREDFADGLGKGYRYICRGLASLNGRVVAIEGIYSTRDEFLGKKSGQWRPLEEINESDIQAAARHVFTGNAVKALLGLRNLPSVEYERIMRAGGQDPTKTKIVGRGAGGQAATPDEAVKQRELAGLCMSLAEAAWGVASKNGAWHVRPITDEEAERTASERAIAICISISGFKGKDGAWVKGLPAQQLKTKRLDATIRTARALVDETNRLAGEGELIPPE